MKLNKTQQYAIEHLHGLGKSPEEISNELDISIKNVSATISKLPEPQLQPKTQEPDNKPKGPSDFMINKSQTGRDRGVMIMTQQASMLSEKAQKSVQSENPAIFRPKNK